LHEFVTICGNHHGPLFIWQSGSPVSRAEFSSFLSRCLISAGFPNAHIRPPQQRQLRVYQMTRYNAWVGGGLTPTADTSECLDSIPLCE
jgi:hypothetical protein